MYDPTLNTGDRPTIEGYLPESDSYLISYMLRSYGKLVRSTREHAYVPRAQFVHIRTWLKANHGLDDSATDAHVLRRVDQYYDGYQGNGFARWYCDYREGLRMTEDDLERVAHELNAKFAAGI